MIRLAARLAAGIAIGIGSQVAGAVIAPNIAENVNNPIAIRGCVIRFDTLNPTGTQVIPRIHTDTLHQCVGVTSVAVDYSGTWTDGQLIVTNAGGTPMIVSLSVDEDETLTQRQIECAASGGGTTSRISCFKNGVYVRADSTLLYAAGSNLWLTWFAWDATP